MGGTAPDGRGQAHGGLVDGGLARDAAAAGAQASSMDDEFDSLLGLAEGAETAPSEPKQKESASTDSILPE